MPKARPTVCSFYVIRREEFPHIDPAMYFGLLKILDRSCARLGLRHIVLTDEATRNSPLWPEGMGAFASPLPQPLMQACTRAQSNWLEFFREGDTLFTGADCVVLADPSKHLPRDPALCLSYRSPGARYPINNGFQLIRRHSADKVAELYRRIADGTGEKWCDDQRSIRAELEPMPPDCGVYERAGLSIAFVPMHKFNRLPKSAIDPCRDACVMHFRGKRHATGEHRKELMVAWAKVHGYA